MNDLQTENIDNSSSNSSKMKIYTILKYSLLGVGILIVSILIIAVLALIYIYPTFEEYNKKAYEIVNDSSYSDFILNETSYIYDDEGVLISSLKVDYNSTYLEYDDIPEDVVDAFVAVEDRTFWENSGFDLLGIMRVFYNYITSNGDDVSGASTITQQVVKNIYLSSEVSIERKAVELLTAMYLTNKYSKEDIMEFYCNDIYFANGYYGIGSASQGYFSKSVSELTLSEVAYLCAIPNSPTYYDPLVYPENVLTRRNTILDDMLEMAFISDEEYEEAIAQEIVLSPATVEYCDYQATYAIYCATEYIMKLNDFEFQYSFETDEEYTNYNTAYNEAYEIAKRELYTSGYEIYTSLNSDAQIMLQSVIDENLSFSEDVNEEGIYELQGAATVVDNDTGNVIAIVGGRTQESTSSQELNRAFQSYRQPGSAIKPLIVYTPALASGFNADSILTNISVEDAYEQGADIDSLTGSTRTLLSAVTYSTNGCALYLFNLIGIDVGMSYIEEMNFANIVPADYTIAAALGGFTYGVTTEEMAGAYSALASKGMYEDTTCITSIKKDGQLIYQKAETKQVYPLIAACNMIEILENVVTEGTASSLNWESDIPIAGKTGTTNDNKDAWFCGVSPYYSIAVWVGNDMPEENEELYGGSYSLTIWGEAMSSLLEGKEVADFPTWRSLLDMS